MLHNHDKSFSLFCMSGEVDDCVLQFQKAERFDYCATAKECWTIRTLDDSDLGQFRPQLWSIWIQTLVISDLIQISAMVNLDLG